MYLHPDVKVFVIGTGCVLIVRVIAFAQVFVLQGLKLCACLCVYVFLQETGVGKSSIVWRFVEDSFDPNINPTIG